MDIIVGTDLSENSKVALKWGALLADQMGATLTVVHVVDLSAGDNAWRILVETPEEIETSAVDAGKKALQKFYDETVDVEPDVTLSVRLGSPMEEIIDAIDDKDDPVVIVGTRGASRLKEILLGNTARRLVRHNHVPTILVPPNVPVETPERIVLGADFSDVSRETIRRAAAMARNYGATVHVVHGYVLPEVAAFDGSYASMTTIHEELVEDKRRALEKMVVTTGAEDVVDGVSVLHLSPAQGITSTAKDLKAQFIFVGTHSRTGMARFFLGNTAERVIRNAPCPIFVVPFEESDEG